MSKAARIRRLAGICAVVLAIAMPVHLFLKHIEYMNAYASTSAPFWVYSIMIWGGYGAGILLCLIVYFLMRKKSRQESLRS